MIKLEKEAIVMKLDRLNKKGGPQKWSITS